MILEEQPSRPGAKVSMLEAGLLSTVSSRRRSDPRHLSLAMRQELDWIALKTLEKDRNCQYKSASALAKDVRRYLDDEPVEACPPSVRYRVQKVAKRH